jgi:tetratricopeptide (TPR) repeat protein
VHTSIRTRFIAACCFCFAAPAAIGQPVPGQQGDDEITDDIEAPAESLAPPNWFETRLAIEELADDGDFAAAAALGDRLLELATKEFGPGTIGVAEAHLLLADIQRRAKNFADAEVEILSAIEIYESESGPTSPDLIDPYLNLGDNYSEAGDYGSAISAYNEARTLGRRNFGLLNLDQIPIIDAMTAAAEKLGQLEEALELQLEALSLVERNYSATSVETIEAMYKYASWLRARGRYDEELRFYFQIQKIIKDHFNDDPLMNVRALRARAASFRRANNGEGLALSGLRDALEYLEEMEDPPIQLMAEVLVDIGDWNVEFSRTGAIGSDYLAAWTLLGQLENGEELREQWFDQLTVVEISSLSLRGLTTDPEAPEGYVVVYFTVSPIGRAMDIEITDSQPPGLKDGAVSRLIREARFRPSIVNGEMTAARRAYRFGFRYLVPDAEE